MNDSNGAEQVVVPEKDIQKEVMKGVARSVLDEAARIIEEQRLSSKPEGNNLARVFYGHENGKGYGYAQSAADLKSMAETGLPSFSKYDDARLATITDPVAKEAALEMRQLQERSLAVQFGSLPIDDLRNKAGFGDSAAGILVKTFAEKLGFLGVGTDIRSVATIEGNRFTITHPSNGTVFETNVVGTNYDGSPKFNGFVIRYAS